MATTETVGISRLVLYRRERAVLLEPRGKGIVVWTLRYGDEVRPDKDYFDKNDGDKLEPGAMKLIKELIDKRTVPWDPEMVSDPVQEKLLDIISAKKKKRKRPAKAKASVDEKPSNVVNIMDALRKSVASEKASKSR
jgi:DNA end-binding protein Ku